MSWENMPSEMKEMILKHTTKSTRLALGACSTNDKELVSSMKFKTLPQLFIGRFSYYLEKETISETRFGDDNEEFDSFVEFQREVQKKLKEYHFITKLHVFEMESKIQLQHLLSGNQRKLKVEKLDFETANGELMSHIISQVEPMYLRELTINDPNTNEAIFSTPQVMQCERLYVKEYVETKIREDQLLKLEARIIEIENGITFSANQFFKKCLAEANSKIIEFEFIFTDVELIDQSFQDLTFVEKRCANGKYIRTMDSPYPHLKLKVSVGFNQTPNSMQGEIEFDSEKSASLHSIRDNTMLRIIKKLRVKYFDEDKLYSIDIHRADQPMRSFTYESSEEAQRKLDEILENADYITVFCMSLKGSEYSWKFEPRQKLLTIGSLSVYNYPTNETLTNLLLCVEPVSLKELRIDSGFLPTFDCLDVPQVTLTNRVELHNTKITDDQLMKMNGQILRIKNTEKEYNWCDDFFIHNDLTDAGLNKYFKKCLQNLQTCDFYFAFELFEEGFDEKELLADLDVISNEMDRNTFTRRIVINSVFEEYVYEIEIYQMSLYASRELRNKPVVVKKEKSNVWNYPMLNLNPSVLL